MISSDFPIKIALALVVAGVLYATLQHFGVIVVHHGVLMVK